MSRKRSESRKAKGIPKYGRSSAEVEADMGLQSYSADVLLGNNDPTVVLGVMYGGMPNASRIARGSLRAYDGKYTRGIR